VQQSPSPVQGPAAAEQHLPDPSTFCEQHSDGVFGICPLGTQHWLLALHVVWWFELHVALAVHCESALHPHVPPLHFGPGLQLLVLQVVHVPDVPHALSAVPAAHVPFVAAVQQPPLHAVRLAPPHAVPHLCCDVSQA
jgi:hypothetical protein